MDKKQENKLNKEFDLSGTKIEFILNWIYENKLSGSLNLENIKEKGEIFFLNGTIINASLGLLEGERAVISFVIWQGGKAFFKNLPKENLPPSLEENVVYETEFLIENCDKERKIISKIKDIYLDGIYQIIDSGTATYIKTTELTLLPWLDGKTSLREIAQDMGKDYPGILKSAYKLYKENIIFNCK